MAARPGQTCSSAISRSSFPTGRCPKSMARSSAGGCPRGPRIAIPTSSWSLRPAEKSAISRAWKPAPMTSSRSRSTWTNCARGSKPPSGSSGCASMCSNSRACCRSARTANGFAMRRKSGSRSNAMLKRDPKRNSVTAIVRTVTRSTSVPSLKSVSLLVVAVLTVGPSGRPAVAQSRPISDNSFLIEEAYNQEPGVVQHISAWQRALRSAAWSFTFTQEWPVGSQTHQFSYTIPVQRTESPSRTGLGDAALNYRYQLRGGEEGVAIAPRLSMLLPTGSSARGLGTGHVGVQLNMPASASLAPWLVSHWNAGISAVPQTPATYNLSASAIWLARPTFNVMVEGTLLQQGGGGAHDLVVNPGIRWAHNFTSGLQIVPGVAFPDGKSVFLYLSFEHRFKPADRP